MVRTSCRTRLLARLQLRELELRAVPTTFTVNATNDEATDSDGKLSLREALAAADNSVGADSINFDAAVFGAAQTITLTATLGELAVRSPVTVTGPAATCTVNANGKSRVLNIDDGATGGIAVTFSGLTLTGGATAGDGGAVLVADETVTFNLMTVSSSTAGGKGGAIFTNLSALKLISTTLTLNTSTGDGGALYTFKGGVEIDSSTIDNNNSMAGDGGGVCFDQSGGLGPFAGLALVKNSTVSQNGGERGGAFKIRDTNTAVANSTIADNDANVQGGGMDVDPAELILISSIVSRNKAPGGDIFVDNGSTLSYSFSAVGDITLGPTAKVNDNGGNLTLGTNLLLGTLTQNGGPTQTYTLGSGSPAIDAGANPLGLALEQRGPGFPRVLGDNGIDMGSTETQSPTPTGYGPFGNIPTAPLNPTVHQFTVTYQDLNSNIDTTSFDNADIVVAGPGGFSASAKFISAGPTNQVVAAVYEITPPGGAWDSTDSGTYTVTVNNGQVFDTDTPSPKSVPGRAIGTFEVNVPPNLIVNAVNDEIADTDGRLSLREALALANSFAGADTITFDASLFATPRTIFLTQGVLPISDVLTLVGPGSGKLTVSGNLTSRIFDIAVAGSLNPISLSGLTATGGGAATDGGGITMGDESVTLTDVVVTGNKSTLEGGGINVSTSTASLTLVDCVVSNNTTGTGNQDGGGINVDVTATSAASQVVTLIRTTVSGNVAGGGGGGIYMFSGGTLDVQDSTISGNSANTTSASEGGGGIYMFGAAVVTIRNSTISGNRTGAEGGGILFDSNGGTLTVQNSTIVYNSAGIKGGGISNAVAGATITIDSTVVAKNTDTVSPIGPDVFNTNAAKFTANASFIGDPTGATILGAPLTGDPLLGLLTNYGGKTPTHLPAAGSPLRDAGANPAGLTNDQRGTGFPRQIGAQIDIGAVESDGTQPVALPGVFADVLVGGETSYSLTVQYVDDVSINLATLDNADIRATGPGGFNMLAKFVSSTPGTGAPVETATYSFTPPGGDWGGADNGTYTISLDGNQVTDAGGQPIAGGALGTFRVAIARSLIVLNDNDAGFGSLRQAILDANSIIGTVDTITFDPTFFSTPRTISLSSGEMAITDGVTINSPGSGLVTVNNVKAASTTSRIFNINGAGVLMVNVTGLTISGGNTSAAGGAVTIADESVTFANCIFANNKSTSTGGGAIAVATAQGKAVFVGCMLSGNSVTGTADGGALRGTTNSVIIVQDSVVSGNTSADDGGALYSTGGSIFILNSSLVNNAATGASSDGGAVFLAGTAGAGGWVIRNSTLSGNNAKINGGAIGLTSTATGTLLVQNSTLTNNVAQGNGANQGGGGLHSADVTAPFTAPFSIESTILSNNVNGAAPDVFTKGTLDYMNSAVGSLTGVSTPNNLGGNLGIGTPLVLGALAYNGGPTGMLTHLPGSTSPVRDAGSNPAGLSTDQRGAGFVRILGVAVDMGAIESAAAAPPTVAAVAVNGGGVQRSIVTSIKVTFSEGVAFPGGIGAAFQLARVGPGLPTGLINLNAVQAGSDVTITFLPGGPVDTDPASSLKDGSYQLTIIASAVQGAGGSLDGDGNGTGGDNFVSPTAGPGRIHRLFGDNDGDGDVDAQDFGAFRQAFGTANVPFDFDADGDVDATDFGQFRARFGSSV